MIRTRDEIREHVEASKDVPTLPTVVNKLFEMFRNPKADATKVADIIAEDQSLTAKTLKLVNSAFYGFPRRIDNIARAIVIMGFSKVRNIALTASILGAFNDEEEKEKERGSTFDFAGFWEHSLGVAIAAEALGKSIDGVEAEDAFVCGLLHDIGKLILSEFLEEEFQAVRKQLEVDGGLMMEAEEKVLQLHHGLIGKWIADRWKFPPRILAVLQHHHEPTAARDGRDITAIVHVADILARAVNIGYPGDDRIPALDERVWGALDLTSEQMDRACDELFEGLAKAQDFLDLIHGD